MIVRRRRLYSLAEVFFDEDPTAAKADVIDCLQRPEPLAGSARCDDFHTILIDLDRDEDTIFGGLTKSARYKVRRADDRDGLTCDVWPAGGDAPVEEFVRFFDRFAAGKNLPPVPRDRLDALAAVGALDLSRVRCPDGDTLVWHAHLWTPVRARLLHSASLYRESGDTGFRSLVSRANRWLHWRDLLRYKAQGLATYDLGGWYAGDEDDALLQINRFKEEWGGTVVREFHCAVAGTMRGRLVLHARRLRARARLVARA
jgi:hypothetical protein